MCTVSECELIRMGRPTNKQTNVGSMISLSLLLSLYLLSSYTRHQQLPRRHCECMLICSCSTTPLRTARLQLQRHLRYWFCQPDQYSSVRVFVANATAHAGMTRKEVVVDQHITFAKPDCYCIFPHNFPHMLKHLVGKWFPRNKPPFFFYKTKTKKNQEKWWVHLHC